MIIIQKEDVYNGVRFAHCSKEQGARFWDCSLEKKTGNGKLKTIKLENVLDMYIRGGSISHRINARPLDNGRTIVKADLVKDTHCIARYDSISAEKLGVVDAKQLTCNVGIIEPSEWANIID